MGLLPKQIASCTEKLNWCFAWSWPEVFRSSVAAFIRLCLGLYFQSLSTFVPVEGRKWSCDRYITRQHTIAHKTRKTWHEPFRVRFMLCAALKPQIHLFQRNNLPTVLYFRWRYSLEERYMLAPSGLAFANDATHFLQSVISVGMGKLV